MRPQIEIVRLMTVHPALVHFALGGLPIMLVGYLLAWWRRSERWAFVGDVAAVITAAAATASLASGLLSNALVPWPGGLETWRAIHLTGGVASALILNTLAISRLVGRRRHPVSGNGAVAGALTAAAVVGFTGWVGGDVLVFHSGMAVKAAGYGATAPPTSTARRVPHDLLDAMGQIRGSWAATTDLAAAMIVEEPHDRDFDVIVDQSRRLEELARWVAATGGKSGRPGDEAKAGSHLARMATDLATRAQALGASARQRDLPAVTTALGQTESVCAHCHDSER
jgi:uncharacterized membrane protein